MNLILIEKSEDAFLRKIAPIDPIIVVNITKAIAQRGVGILPSPNPYQGNPDKYR